MPRGIDGERGATGWPKVLIYWRPRRHSIMRSRGRGATTFGTEMPMTTYTAVVERDAETGLYVGHVPGFPGAHFQAGTLDELNAILAEVIAILSEDGPPTLEADFVGTQTVKVRSPAMPG
jgi:predicted RNase H-like HicB family nuclease